MSYVNMDDVDLKLLTLLSEDPRRSYRDLADELKISTPAVHRRIQAAQEKGYIIGPFVNIAPCVTGSIIVYAWGRSKIERLDLLQKEMAKNDSVYIVHVTSGMYILVRGYLKSVNDLERFSSFVKKAAQIPELEIGILSYDDERTEEHERAPLTLLDMKIIKALHKDGRKSVNDVAQEIHVSPKTVRRRLDKMEKDENIVIDMYINQNPTGDIACYMFVKVDDEADKKKVSREITSKFAPPLLAALHFSNRTNLFMTTAWFHNTNTLKEHLISLEAEKGIRSVQPHILVTSFRYETWCDKLLENPQKAFEAISR